jgi:hypothetical protein
MVPSTRTFCLDYTGSHLYSYLGSHGILFHVSCSYVHILYYILYMCGQSSYDCISHYSYSHLLAEVVAEITAEVATEVTVEIAVEIAVEITVEIAAEVLAEVAAEVLVIQLD